MRAYLETNGILPEALEDIIADIDIIAMDIKMPSSTKQKSYWKEHEEFLKIALGKEVFLKAVVSADTQMADMRKAVDLVVQRDPTLDFIIQPNTFELKNGVMKKCLEFHDYSLKYLPNARVMPQMHKVMRIR